MLRSRKTSLCLQFPKTPDKVPDTRFSQAGWLLHKMDVSYCQPQYVLLNSSKLDPILWEEWENIAF